MQLAKLEKHEKPDLWKRQETRGKKRKEKNKEKKLLLFCSFQQCNNFGKMYGSFHNFFPQM
jgi:hypothetical protein